ncbi:MAG: diaminopimelate decarboxylase [Bacteroidales bacterium]|nr:MAG: diaminopimelate decarboxylase [Bacteroidales bacterium]
MSKQVFERPTITKLSPGVPSKHGVGTVIAPMPMIDGVKVDDLMDTYGSPLYVFSERTIRRTMEDVKRAFSVRYPKVQMAWSYKTNYLDSICRIFHQEGSWAEVVSGFEYDKAIRNGVKGENIIFNGPAKSAEELEKAAKNGSFIHIDHFDELFMLSDVCQRKDIEARVSIRVNMDVGIYPKWDRFGLNYENGEAWDALNRIMLNPKLKLMGLHTHIGTYMMSTDAYRIAAAKLAALADEVAKKFDYYISYIDMGGGFASKNTLRGAYLSGEDTTPSFDEYAEAITSAIIDSQIKPDKLPTLILETGRALIDNAGYISGTVLANKRLSDSRRATIVDVGVNLLFTAFWYDHKIHPVGNHSGLVEETTIYGPLCMNIDVLRPSLMFPALKRGDRFVVTRTGAYNNTQWLQFITTRPNVVLIGMNRDIHQIRKAETLEYITVNEIIPEYLSKKLK